LKASRYDEAIYINPESVYAWEGKEYALTEFGRSDKAGECYKKAEELLS
jgi:tetratricopeptide (TPR) repeat protein